MRSIGTSENKAVGETKRRAAWLNPALAFAVLFAATGWFNARSEPVVDRRYDGFNLIAAPGHPFGSVSADLALGNAKALGAKSVAVIPFFWQADRQSPDLVRGSDMSDDELRAAIREAHAGGTDCARQAARLGSGKLGRRHRHALRNGLAAVVRQLPA